MTAAAAVCGITDQQLAALQSGGWRDDVTDTPGWQRLMETSAGGLVSQMVRPDGDSKWYAYSGLGSRSPLLNSFEEVLAWCDEWAGELVPKAGTATKQEDRFALLAERRG